MQLLPDMALQSSVQRQDPCGKRLLPTLIDSVAASEPDRTWASVPISQNLEDGFLDISYGQLADAVDMLAH